MATADLRRAVVAIHDSARARNASIDQIVATIVERCGVSRLRAHRLARGWTLQQVVTKMQAQGAVGSQDLGHTRVSRWECGDRPSPRYLDELCKLYETRADLLGFGGNYSNGPRTPSSGEAAALGSRSGSSEPNLDALEQSQEMLRRAFSPVNSASRESVQWWQDRVFGHAADYRATPARRHLSSALMDFDGLCALLNQRQSIAHQVLLTNAAARLAGIIGILLVDLGRPRESRSWFASGRLAAGAVDNDVLTAWLTSREALTCLYYEDPRIASTLARRAAEITGSSPSVASALAPAVEARAQSQMGRDREAIQLMKLSESRLKDIASTPRSIGALGFSGMKLRFYAGNVWARSGRPDEAVETCREVLRSYPEYDLVDRTHIRLDEAVALFRLGEVDASSRLAGRVLAALPSYEGAGTVLAHVDELVRVMLHNGAVAAARKTRQSLTAGRTDPGIRRTSSATAMKGKPNDPP